ncbi:hypothetical protein PESP_b0418 [Pseudoalteromonas espejiana DSM 9414]|nr:hypothetical protein PESP_b0418 [Pseudoalteromonas espejiana DSM 9414]
MTLPFSSGQTLGSPCIVNFSIAGVGTQSIMAQPPCVYAYQRTK